MVKIYGDLSVKIDCEVGAFGNLKANGTALSTVSNTTNETEPSKPGGFEHPSLSILSPGVHAFFVIIYLMVFIIGASGNSLVCFILGRKSQLKKGDVFIVSLAIADLIACIIWPLHMITYHSYTYSAWFFQPGTQAAFFFVFYTTLMVSSWQLLLISIDRYWAITKLIKWQRISMTKKVATAVFSWVLAACVKFPLTWRMNFGISDEGYKIYLMVWTCLGWIIPLIIVSVLYTLSIKKLKSQAVIKDKSETAMRRREENQRVVKMFIIIVGLYFIFTIPHSIIDLFRYIDNKSDAVVVLHECSVIIVLFNSCTNPFIYARMHRDVNSFVVGAWRKVKGKKKYITESTTEGASAETDI
ncbi:compound eye opsin BCRH2-like isoform X1 [Rhopilema esculentum]|uniref:compound eye opsin BCRH2-like isoform X1 n=1 Tax=Rhopilema esculentum TaxID=499914 RepID=UPI0031D23869